MKMKITQQAFDKWVNQYYNEVITKINKGEMTWANFGKGVTLNNPNYANSRGLLLINLKNGKTAHSYCHPDDKWNIYVGLAVAYAHYMGVEVPEVEKTYHAIELVGKEILYRGKRVFITPYGNKWSLYVVSINGVIEFIGKDYVIFEDDIITEEGK